MPVALEGMEKAIEPPEPMATTRDLAGGGTLPMDRKQAIDAFDRSESVVRVFAPILRETFVGMKKQELRVFSQQISPFEHETCPETV
jgi:glutamine synthetase